MEPEAINWYRSPIEKSALRQLTQKSDLMGWLQAGSFLTIYLSLTALAFCMFLMRLWVIMVIVCYLQSVFMSFVSMGAAVHELSHGTPFRSKGPNEFFLYVFSFLTLNNPIHLRASHIQNHHPFTVHRGRDKEVIQGPVKEKLNWVNMVSWVTFDFRWFAVCIRANVLHALGRSGADFFYWDPLFREDDPRRKQMCRWARFMVVSYILFLAVFLVLHLWVLVYLVVFSCFFGRIVANLLTATQHTGLGENIPDWRAVCHTVTVNPVVGYLYWHMNYHIEHHMYAAVPFFNLKKLRVALEPDMPPAHRGLFACLQLLYAVRSQQRADPAYVHLPRFPTTAAPARLR